LVELNPNILVWDFFWTVQKHLVYILQLAVHTVQKNWISRSKSEQAPGSEFHPRDESEKIDCGFLGPSWCNKKINPETYVPCGSYELLLSNVAHQMKGKLTIQNKFSNY
jgi:hypothetical protein